MMTPRRHALFGASALLGLFALGGATGAALAQSAPTNGFQVVPHRVGRGRVLLRQEARTRSARDAVRQSMSMLARVLDRAPRMLAGMVSRDDDTALVSFAGHHQGQLVQGYLTVQRDAVGALVAVVMDEPNALTRNAAALLAVADAAQGPGRDQRGASPSPPNPYGNLRWKRVPFGTGQIDLPQDWNIVGQHQGAVDIVGPAGEVVSLGAASQVMTPEAARYWMNRGLPPQIYVAPASSDPIAAFRNVQPQIERAIASRGGPVVRLTKVVEADRIPFGNFAAALVASEGVGSLGQQAYRKLSLVAAGAVMANGNWLYYNSEVYAPTALYPHALPVMLKVWNSWTVDKSVLMERLVSAAKSMRETNAILRGIHDNRIASQDRISAAWGHHIRGTVVVRDASDGRQSTEWLYQPGPAASGLGTEHNRHMGDVVRDANQAAGYARWQLVDP